MCDIILVLEGRIPIQPKKATVSGGHPTPFGSIWQQVLLFAASRRGQTSERRAAAGKRQGQLVRICLSRFCQEGFRSYRYAVTPSPVRLRLTSRQGAALHSYVRVSWCECVYLGSVRRDSGVTATRLLLHPFACGSPHEKWTDGLICATLVDDGLALPIAAREKERTAGKFTHDFRNLYKNLSAET